MKQYVGGLNTSLQVHFKVHSTRSTLSSKTKKVAVSYTEILKRGFWKRVNTFSKQYNKHIINKDDDLDLRLCYSYYK